MASHSVVASSVVAFPTGFPRGIPVHFSLREIEREKAKAVAELGTNFSYSEIISLPRRTTRDCATGFAGNDY